MPMSEVQTETKSTIVSTRPQPESLAARLVSAREAKELTTSQLARRLGVRTNTLRNWEQGKSEPRSNRLMTLAGMLDVPVYWLISGDEAMKPTGLNPPYGSILATKLARAQRLQADLARLLGEIADGLAVLNAQQRH